MTAAMRYARVQGGTASSERLLVLLLQTARARMLEGAEALEGGDTTRAGPLLDRASDIVWELARTLDHHRAPGLTKQLDEVYAFVSKRLLDARLSSSAGPVREAERAFAPLVDAFESAVASLGAAP